MATVEQKYKKSIPKSKRSSAPPLQFYNADVVDGWKLVVYDDGGNGKRCARTKVDGKWQLWYLEELWNITLLFRKGFRIVTERGCGSDELPEVFNSLLDLATKNKTEFLKVNPLTTKCWRQRKGVRRADATESLDTQALYENVVRGIQLSKFKRRKSKLDLPELIKAAEKSGYIQEKQWLKKHFSHFFGKHEDLWLNSAGWAATVVGSHWVLQNENPSVNKFDRVAQQYQERTGTPVSAKLWHDFYPAEVSRVAVRNGKTPQEIFNNDEICKPLKKRMKVFTRDIFKTMKNLYKDMQKRGREPTYCVKQNKLPV